MNYRFENILNSASANKQAFDSSIAEVRRSLHDSLHEGNATVTATPAKTGWLKGSLSYPWVIVCSLIPSLKDLM
jgi:hypothetical protein